MLGVVIGEKVAWMVDKDCPKAFEYKGGYYLKERDYEVGIEYYKNLKEAQHGER